MAATSVYLQQLLTGMMLTGADDGCLGVERSVWYWSAARQTSVTFPASETRGLLVCRSLDWLHPAGGVRTPRPTLRLFGNRG